MNSIQALQTAFATLSLTEHDFYSMTIRPDGHQISLQGKLNGDRLYAVEKAGYKRFIRENSSFVMFAGSVPTENDVSLWNVEVILT